MEGLYCISILILIIIALSGYTIRKLYEEARVKVNSISFKDTFVKTDVAVISLYNNGKKLNFIVDSGSSLSLITKSVIPELKYETLGASGAEFSTFNGDANLRGYEAIKMSLTGKSNTFLSDFVVADLDSSFLWDKDELGEKIHGILGSKFLQEQGLLLDFNTLSIYSK